MKNLICLKTLLLLCLIAFQLNLSGANQTKSDLSVKADSLLQAENFDAAIVAWNKLITTYPEDKHELSLFQSKLHYTQGLKSSSESNYTEASKSFKKAVDVGKKLRAKESANYLKDLYTNYYHSLAYSGDWQAALQISQEGMEHFVPHMEGKNKADYIYDYAYLNDRLGNYAKAIEHYETSIDILTQLQEKHYFDIGLAYNNLSTNYKAMGFFSARLNSLEKAKKYWEMDAEQIDYDYFITLYGNLLKVYIEYGALDQANEMLQKVDSTLLTKEFTVNHVVNQHRLHIILYAAKNDIAKAKSRMDKYLDFYNSLEEANQKKYQSQLLASIQSLVDLLTDKDYWKDSEVYLKHGLKLANNSGNLYFQMALNAEYSKISELKGEPQEMVIAYLDEALNINNQTNIGQENLITLNLRKAHHYQIANKIDRSKKYILLAFNFLEKFKDSSLFELNETHFKQQQSIYIIRALVNAGGLYESFYASSKSNRDIELSFHLYKLAASVFETYYQKGSYNASLNYINKDIQEGIFTTLSLMNKPLSSSLLDLIEKNNSQALRKEFEAKQKQFTQIPPELLNKRNVLFAQLTNLNEKIEEFPDSTLLVNERREIQSKNQSLSTEIKRIDPRFDQIYTTDLTVSTIQDKLSNRELIIKYIQGNQHSFALLLSKDNIQFIELGSRQTIDSAVADYYSSIQHIKNGYEKLSMNCYNLTILPFEEQLSKFNSLVIIPDGKLSYLPFESLKAVENNSYLIQSHEISYNPSLSLWYLSNHAIKESKENKKKLIAAFAPTYSNAYYSNLRSENIENRLDDIKGATAEAQLITENFGGDLFSREQASKLAFIEQTNNYQIYHLAMHTLYDDEQSQNSELVFQNEEKLGFNELYALHFPAEMVVLSACNTGIGELKAGEGMQSLSQALSYAGVQSSVYSLWPVPDKETAQIMQLFYEKLQAGTAKNTALAEAKRAFIENNPLHTHPYFWAGFVLQGKQNPIQGESNNWQYWIAIGLSILILLSIVLRKLKII